MLGFHHRACRLNKVSTQCCIAWFIFGLEGHGQGAKNAHMDDQANSCMPPAAPGPRESHATSWHIGWWFFALAIYVLSTGPVAWAVNNNYLPDSAQVVYLPLMPLMKVTWISDLFFFYTVRVWGGFPYGYTTI
jgi:hypothetical protein